VLVPECLAQFVRKCKQANQMEHAPADHDKHQPKR
jgi:hypothetical protein